MKTMFAAVLGVLAAALPAAAQERWDKDLGKPAPRLVPAGWSGTPVSLDALRKSGENEASAAAAGATVDQKAEISGGNTVLLAFWNADIPC